MTVQKCQTSVLSLHATKAADQLSPRIVSVNIYSECLEHNVLIGPLPLCIMAEAAEPLKVSGTV